MNFKSMINYCLYLFLININFVFSNIEKEEFFGKFRNAKEEYNKARIEY